MEYNFIEELDFLLWTPFKDTEKFHSSLFHASRTPCRYIYYSIFTSLNNNLFLFLASIGLGASRRQTWCPHMKAQQEIEGMGHLQNPVMPLFWLNNKATAKQKKRTVHFWRPRDAQCRNGRRKIKPVQVLWVTSCLYPVTPHWQLLWLHLEGQWCWQSHNWPTHLPHATP